MLFRRQCCAAYSDMPMLLIFVSRIKAMTEQPSEEDLTKWHRRFAVEANNRAWTLAEKPELTSEERTELLYAAYAAAHHWSKIGTIAQVALAELLLGRVHAVLGHGDLAMKFATSAFNAINSRETEPWEVAFAHAILANAAAVSGDAELHAQHYVQAKALGESLETQDRDLFRATFDLIPTPRQSRQTG
jgi:hypothetical protein